ncbi:MAG TPA: hypothetical protein VFU01_10870 [Gemmatimonadaceae bacterium]|nr:hypothetical protein [Gemmatimonadaceae bacterium]
MTSTIAASGVPAAAFADRIPIAALPSRSVTTRPLGVTAAMVESEDVQAN